MVLCYSTNQTSEIAVLALRRTRQTLFRKVLRFVVLLVPLQRAATTGVLKQNATLLPFHSIISSARSSKIGGTDPERLGGLEINDQLDLRGLHDG